jgi:glutamate N-acetyltransferase / amino-acid N-acetyltransferase
MSEQRAARSFFASRWVEVPDWVREEPGGGLAAGFRAAGVAAGIKPSGGRDVGLLVSDAAATTSAARFTRSGALASPVLVTQERARVDALRAVVVNSGNANAATGEQGYRDALAMRDAAAEALGLEPRGVAVAETGTIGVPLAIEAVRSGIAEAAGVLSGRGGADFCRAIITTDRSPKRCTVRAGGVTLSAQAKGAGMIEPGLATMLCFVQTDAVVVDPATMLRDAVAVSFERITVDGQMSTNDAVLLQATGSSDERLPAGLLESVLLQLALEIVADGEGATRIARVSVEQASTAAEADRVARAVANSPLVKTALYGRDPNWGRIAQSAGMALAGEDLDGLGPDAIDAAELGSETAEADLAVRLGRGDASAEIYFSDLTPGYVELNSEYTS